MGARPTVGMREYINDGECARAFTRESVVVCRGTLPLLCSKYCIIECYVLKKVSRHPHPLPPVAYAQYVWERPGDDLLSPRGVQKPTTINLKPSHSDSTPEWFVATLDSRPMQQPQQIGSSEAVQTRVRVQPPLFSYRRPTLPAMPSLALAEPGVGATPPTANMMEKFTTNASTELNTPDIKFEGIMGDKAIPFYSNSNLHKESSPGLGEIGGELGVNEGENQELPSSTQFPNLSTTLYVDMSPSFEVSPESDIENEGTNGVPLKNIDDELPTDLRNLLDNIIINDNISPLNENSSENVDISLMETEDSPELLEIEQPDNIFLESSYSPIINDTMMSPTNIPVHQQEQTTTAITTGPINPLTLSIPEEEDIVPPEITKMYLDYFENFETIKGPAEDFELTENYRIDQEIIDNDNDKMELPTSPGQEDQLQRVLQQCGVFMEQNMTPSTHPAQLEESTSQLPPSGDITNLQCVMPSSATQINLPATALVPVNDIVSTDFNHPIVVQSMVRNESSGFPVNTSQISVPITLIQNVANFENPQRPTQPSVVYLEGTSEPDTVIQNVKANSNLELSAQSSQPRTSVQHPPRTSLNQVKVKRLRRSIKKPLRLQDSILDEASLETVERVAGIHMVDSNPLHHSPGHELNTLSDEKPNSFASNTHLNTNQLEPVASTSSGRRRGGRQSSIGLTDQEKYRRTRLLNNIASKRCREKRKTKLGSLEEEENDLRKRNTDLKQRVALLSAKRDKMKALVDMVFAKSVQAKYGNR
ncbi:hypothetical protein Pmani_014802 [Petrolisthes manimaculis]|uniref:BZIP domain-containing protein n=1 Tax=Petrolisthes manimaculis TaxID=1843537 RepID=A0AAE1PTI1_9EUCA|nr:hypothetical protein Pmani_014802 [Petrolisthes manimaculis]